MDTCVSFENSPIRNIISSPTIIVASFIYTSSALPELGIEDHSYGEDTNGNKKPASNAKRYPLCENRRIPFTRNPPVSCLLGRCPNPRRTQNLCSETTDSSSRIAYPSPRRKRQGSVTPSLVLSPQSHGFVGAPSCGYAILKIAYG